MRSSARRSRRAIALLGGTFDPPHDGHLAMARRALKDFPVRAVRMVPNGEPPHRGAPSLPWAERMSLCRKSAASHALIIVGGEEPPGAPRRTIDTVRRHRRRGAQIVLIVGADAFAAFREWRQWRRILRLAGVAVARRGPRQKPHAAVRARMRTIGRHRDIAGGGVLWWRFRPPAISSSQIRRERGA